MPETLLTLREMLAPAWREGYAVAAFGVANAEMADAVLQAAAAEQAPVIVMCGPAEEPVLGLRKVAAITRLLAAHYEVPVCLHLDHATREEMVYEALEAGFPSVMIDHSDWPYAENVAAARRVVEAAARTGASVEAEIGHVGLADGTSSEVITAESHLTQPEEAEAFVAATGVDALAVSVGTAHGLGAGLEELDFARLEEIRRRVEVPLVLHGATGRDPEQLRRAIRLGVAKVNIASDLARAFAETMAEALEAGGGYFWHAAALARMKERVRERARAHMRALGSSGKAGRPKQQHNGKGDGDPPCTPP